MKVEDTSDIIGEPKICAFCPQKTFSSPYTVKQYHNDILCNYCTLLKNKLFEQINKPQNGLYSCSYCHTSDLLFQELIVHLKDHLKMEPCICPGESQHSMNDIEIKEESLLPIEITTFNKRDILCNNSQEIQFNMKKQRREKQFHCQYCEFKCCKNVILNTHRQAKHAGEKSFYCHQCQTKFCRKDKLITHMQKHIGEKPFHCPDCEYKTSDKSYMKIHIRTHTGEKPFQCNQCEYKVSRGDYLKVHMRKHTGETPFHCKLCEYKTSHSPNLKCHMRKHSGEKPFHCNYCNYKATQSHCIKTHMITHHEKDNGTKDVIIK